MFSKTRKLLVVVLIVTALLIIFYSFETLKRPNLLAIKDNVFSSSLYTSSSTNERNINPDQTFSNNKEDASSRNDTFTASTHDQIQLFLLFIGYPRSGTTLIGSLLDAHPHIIIANEYNLITKWKTFSQNQKNKDYVYKELVNASVFESQKLGQRAKEKQYFFSYHVPGLWQGKYKDYIKIIGDKKSTTTTRVLSRNSSRFQEITAAINVPVKFLHLIRNPFDNIATMTLRKHRGLRMKAENEGLQMNDQKTLLKQTNVYLNLIDMNSKLRKRFGRNVLDIHYSSFIRQPKIWLKTICDFLEIYCSEYYIESCVNVIFKEETYTRRHIVWPDDIKEMILKKIQEVDFLSGLKFDIQ